MASLPFVISAVSSTSARPESDRESTPRRRFESLTSKAFRSASFSSQCLSRSKFFYNRDARFLQDVARELDTELYAPGQDIITEGEKDEKLYFLHRGEVEIIVGHGEHAESVARLEDGNVIGEMALFGQCTRTATVRALSVCDCRAINFRVIQRILKRYPEERKYFAAMAAERMGKTKQLKQEERARQQIEVAATRRASQERASYRRKSVWISFSPEEMSPEPSELLRSEDSTSRVSNRSARARSEPGAADSTELPSMSPISARGAQLAEEGRVSWSPDLLSGSGSGHITTSSTLVSPSSRRCSSSRSRGAHRARGCTLADPSLQSWSWQDRACMMLAQPAPAPPVLPSASVMTTSLRDKASHAAAASPLTPGRSKGAAPRIDMLEFAARAVQQDLVPEGVASEGLRTIGLEKPIRPVPLRCWA